MTAASTRNVLVSFHYYGEDDLDQLPPTATVVADSGAYSALMQGAVITTAQLVAWGSKWRHRFAWLASLDVIGDAAATRTNWQEMCAAGIPGVPTLHVGGDWRELDWYAEQGVDFMGLGGLIGTPIPPAAKFRWLVQVFKYARARHPQMRFHGWGVTRPLYLRLPWFSVDSSGWGAAYRYGRLTLRHPQTGAKVEIELDGKAAYEPAVALLLRDHYGVNPSEVAISGPNNRLLMVKLCILSASVHEQNLRRLHRSGVTPPLWGRLGGWNYDQDGPHQHLVLGGRRAGDRDIPVLAALLGETAYYQGVKL